MSVLKTIEVRWFFNAQPFDADDYFRDKHLASPRTDWYAIPSDEACGVKTREGRLETKLRSEIIGMKTFATAVGIVESWAKWSFELPHAEPPSEALLRAANWIAVEKHRYIIRYQMDRDFPREIETLPTNGCSFELTKVIVNEKAYWTVGLEAIGALEDLEPNLTNVFEFLIKKKPLASTFQIENSFGYPKWLNELMAKC